MPLCQPVLSPIMTYHHCHELGFWMLAMCICVLIPRWFLQAGEDTGNMVKSTCTTFLKTLEECMHIANLTFSSDMVSQSPPGSPPVAAVKPQKVQCSGANRFFDNDVVKILYFGCCSTLMFMAAPLSRSNRVT